MNVETVIEIEAPSSRVWEVLSDVERWPEWTASMTSVRRLDLGPLVPGSEAVVKQPRLLRARWRVTELIPGAEFTWQSRLARGHVVGVHSIEVLSDSVSRVTLGVKSSGRLASLLASTTTGIARRHVAMEAAGLKRRCEELTSPQTTV
ncbi:MAG: SRPBCC family protein [Tepidiformaceae bacterium]